jgi:hypothetical protein
VEGKKTGKIVPKGKLVFKQYDFHRSPL